MRHPELAHLDRPLQGNWRSEGLEHTASLRSGHDRIVREADKLNRPPRDEDQCPKRVIVQDDRCGSPERKLARDAERVVREPDAAIALSLQVTGQGQQTAPWVLLAETLERLSGV